MRDSIGQLESQLQEYEAQVDTKVAEVSKKEEELTTYKQHCEHQQKQIQSLMAENESTLKVNNALLYKTKILEQDIKTKDRLIGDLKLAIENIGKLSMELNYML